jgi:hypothetical protein
LARLANPRVGEYERGERPFLTSFCYSTIAFWSGRCPPLFYRTT